MVKQMLNVKIMCIVQEKNESWDFCFRLLCIRNDRPSHTFGSEFYLQVESRCRVGSLRGPNRVPNVERSRTFSVPKIKINIMPQLHLQAAGDRDSLKHWNATIEKKTRGPFEALQMTKLLPSSSFAQEGHFLNCGCIHLGPQVSISWCSFPRIPQVAPLLLVCVGYHISRWIQCLPEFPKSGARKIPKTSEGAPYHGLLWRWLGSPMAVDI